MTTQQYFKILFIKPVWDQFTWFWKKKKNLQFVSMSMPGGVWDSNGESGSLSVPGSSWVGFGMIQAHRISRALSF